MSESTSQISAISSRIGGLANPSRFLALAGRVLPFAAAVTIVLFAIGLFMSLTAPEDYQQGATIRIMFVHVPSAWLSMMCYTVMTL